MAISFVGFVTGVLYVSLLKENVLLNDGILNEDMVSKIRNIEMDRKAFFFLCLGNRLRTFLLLVLLAYSSVNVFFTSLFFGVQGFFVGSVMEVLAIRFGIQGLFIYLGMVFPQGIFYVLGYLCIGCWCLEKERTIETGVRRKVEKIHNRQNYKKTVIAFTVIFFGVLLECWLNPISLQLLVR